MHHFQKEHNSSKEYMKISFLVEKFITRRTKIALKDLFLR